MKKVIIIILILIGLMAVLLMRRAERQVCNVQPPPRMERSNSVPIQAHQDSVPYDMPWKALAAKDYPAFISMMRASGCPEQTLQDLVLMQLAREYQSVCDAHDDAMHLNPEWWHVGRNHASESARVRFWREQRLEMSARVRDLLGVDYGVLVARYLPVDYQPDTWITPEKKLQLFSLLQGFKDDATAIRLGPEGWWASMDATQKAQLAELEISQRTQLASFLTPAELEEYDMRNSDAARYVRENLPPAASEQQFRTMVKNVIENGVPLQERFDERDFEYASAKQAEEDAKDVLRHKIEIAVGADAIAAQTALAEKQTKLEELQKAKEKTEEEAVENQLWTSRYSDMAAEIGLDPALGVKLRELLWAMYKEKEANPPRLQLSADQQKDAVIRAAIQVMGEKGREFIRKMDEKYE